MSRPIIPNPKDKKHRLVLMVHGEYIEDCGDTPRDGMTQKELKNTKEKINSLIKKDINPIP